MRIATFTILTVTAMAFISCSDDGGSNQQYIDAADCTGVSAAYATDVAPILNARCATSGCHSATSAREGLDLSGYASSKAAFDDFAILCSVNFDSGCNRMPQGGSQLSDSDILTLTCWAKNGFAQ
jgi:hypothetical protein